MTLIVGLGNPEEKYKNNRHNIGFMVVDYLIDHLSAKDITKNSFYGNTFKKDDYILLKPTTYMNLSGKSVLAVKNFFKADNIIVIHDDLDLNFGAIRFKLGGGSGGHNGLKSIDSLVGNSYLRARLGIGKPEFKSMVADYVLSDFSSEEMAKLPDIIAKTAKAVLELNSSTLSKVSSKYSQKNAQ